MKTTIKLDQGRALVILPGVLGTTRIDLTMLGVGVGGGNLTPDQAGALMVALERVAEHHAATQARQQGREVVTVCRECLTHSDSMHRERYCTCGNPHGAQQQGRAEA